MTSPTRTRAVLFGVAALFVGAVGGLAYAAGSSGTPSPVSATLQPGQSGTYVCASPPPSATPTPTTTPPATTSSAPPPAGGVLPAGVSGTYKVGVDFSQTTTIDRSLLWTDRYGPNATGRDWDYNPDQEISDIDASLPYIAGGVLHLPIKALNHNDGGRQYPYITSMISGQGGALKFGDNTYLDAYVWMANAGWGVWPAIWEIPVDSAGNQVWPPEIDQAEWGNIGQSGTPTFNFHYTQGGQTDQPTYKGNPDLRGQWHHYGLLRKNGVLTVYLDGKVVAGPLQMDAQANTYQFYPVIGAGVSVGGTPVLGDAIQVGSITEYNVN